MKKVSAVLLAMAMVLSLASCGSKQDPKEIYDAAVKKSQELTSMDVDYEMDMVMSQGDDKMDVSTSMNMKMDGLNTEGMRYLAEGTTTTMGQTVDTTMYYADGYCYMEAMGQKMKYAMDLDKMVEQIKSSTGGGSMDSSYLSDIQAKKDGDDQILTYTADASKMDAYVQEVFGAMGDMGDQLEGLSYTIKEVSGESVVNKDGYVTSGKVRMVMDMTMAGETISMEADTTVIYHNPGQTVEVAEPSLDGYTEIDASLVGF
ncbi:MAG: hypothetical protein HFG22_11450 [Lachnospiraceae bacterium]|nr:hypothetical protein [Lachnospiraceae bacterium]